MCVGGGYRAQISPPPSRYTPPPLDEWEYPSSQLAIKETIGEGAFGVVVRATATDIRDLEGETEVAVKLCSAASPEECDSLLREADLMKLFADPYHTNVIRLLGVCTRVQPVMVGVGGWGWGLRAGDRSGCLLMFIFAIPPRSLSST